MNEFNRNLPSYEYFKILYENMAQGVIFQSSNGDVLFSNPAAEKILGVSSNKFASINTIDQNLKFIHEDGLPFPAETHPTMISVKTGEAVKDTIMGIWFPDENKYHWIKINTVPLFEDEQTRPYLVFVTFDDITELKELNSKLIKSQGNYSNLFNELPSGFALHEIICDEIGKAIDYVTIDLNPSYESILNVKKESVLNKKASEILPAAELKKWLDIFAPVVFNGETVHYKLYSAYNDKYFDGIAYCPEKGRFAVIFSDISQHENDKNALEEEISRRKHFFEQTPVGIVLIDPESTRFVEFNTLAHEQLGYTRDEFYQLRISDIDAEESFEDIRAGVGWVKKQGKTTFEGRQRTKTGDIRDVHVIANAIDYKGKSILQCIFQDITNQKKAENELYYAKEQLIKAQNTAHVGSWTWRIQEDSLEWSDEMFNIFGIDRSNLSGNLSDVITNSIHPDDRAAVDASNSSVLEKGKPIPLEYRLIKPDGSVRTVWAEAGELVLDELGRAKTLSGIVMDITERKRVEQALVDEAIRRRILIEQSRDGIVVLGQDGHVYETNQKFADMLGYSMQEMLQLNVLDWEFLYEPRRTLEMVRSVDEKGDHFETQHRRKNGSTYDVEISTNSAVFGGQKLIFCVCRDITERKQVEAELRQSHALLSNLASLVPGVIYQYRLFPDGRSAFPYSSPGMNDIYECTPEEVREDASPVFGRLHPDDYDMVSNAIQESARTLEEFYCEFRVILPRQGLRWRWSQAHPVRTKDGGTLWHGIISDITDRKLIEAEAIKLREKAEIASRLAVVGEMAAGIAHEINNPLTGIIGFSELLMETKSLPDDVKEDLKNIANSSQRVKDIVKRLLTFARQNKPVRTSHNIHELIDDTLEIRSYVLKTTNIGVIKNYDPNIPWVVVDAGQIQQVFLNLLVNAEYSMNKAHGKGTLTITTEKKEDHIQILFKDDGAGISKGTKEKLFHPFFTTKDVGEGTGLGLSLSRSIILEHQGTIEVKSELEEGATFIVSLPITKQEERSIIIPVSTEPMEQIKQGHVLVVDDEITIRKLVRMILTKNGHVVDETDDATEAPSKIDSNQYDAILMDIRMPGINGMELYNKIIKTHPELKRKFIFVTGDASDTQTLGFLEKVQALHITKPFDRKTLINTINKII